MELIKHTCFSRFDSSLLATAIDKNEIFKNTGLFLKSDLICQIDQLGLVWIGCEFCLLVKADVCVILYVWDFQLLWHIITHANSDLILSVSIKMEKWITSQQSFWGEICIEERWPGPQESPRWCCQHWDENAIWCEGKRHAFCRQWN